MPTPAPSVDCGDIPIYRVYLADSGGDGWQGGTYGVYNTSKGLRVGDGSTMLTGTFEGTMGFVWICLPDGCYEVTVGGGEAPSEIGVFVAGAGWVWGNGSYFFCVRDYDVYAHPTFTPTVSSVPTPLPTGLPTPLPTGLPTQLPTSMPSSAPSTPPSASPSSSPSTVPTSVPSELWVMSVNVEIGLTGIGCATFGDAEAQVMSEAVSDVLASVGQDDVATGGCTSPPPGVAGGVRRRLDGTNATNAATISLIISALSQDVPVSDTAAYASSLATDLTSTVVDGSLLAAMASRASLANLTSLASVGITAITAGTTAPTPLPTPIPSPLPTVTPVPSTPAPSPLPSAVPTPAPSLWCPTGTPIYRIYVADAGGDGWQGGTYSVYDSSSVAESDDGSLIMSGTFADGSEGFEWICLANGCYAVTVGGGSAPSEIGVMTPSGMHWGPGTYYFCVQDQTMYAHPTAAPTISARPTRVPTPAPTEPLSTPGPTTLPVPSPTPKPTPAPTPKPTDVGCTDDRLNGDETDVDCGGSCPGCGLSRSCVIDVDCGSGNCAGGTCVVPDPTAVPTAPPTQPPTLTPCPWLEVPPPPVLEVAKFSSTGGQLFLTWDSGTDRAGYGGASFSCDELIEFPLASAATCVWTSDSELTASLDYRAKCVPGDNVTALGGLLKPYCEHSDCSCWSTVNASATKLLVPDTPLVPEAVFLGASRVGSCSDIALDITSSTGSGGRGWVQVGWTVNGTLPPRNLTLLREYVAEVQALDPTEPRLDVPNTFLQAGETYTFAATLENFLGFSSTSKPFAVVIAAGSIPELIITAGTQYDMLVPSQLALFAQASVAVCPGQKASGKLSYRWECSLAGLQSTSVDPRFFKAAPFTFQAQRTYEVNVLVADVFGFNNSASVLVVVGTSDLVAAVDGGDRKVGVSEPLILDASPSYDPDDPSGGTLDSSWRCEVLEGEENGANCATTLTDTAVNSVDLTNYGAGTYLFSVLVEKYSDGNWRNATASAVITVTFDLVPTVGIAAMTVAKANPSEKLILYGSGGPAPYLFEYTWSLASGDLASGTLVDASSTALVGSIEADVTGTTYLVLPSGTLTAGGLYVFQLMATFDKVATGGISTQPGTSVSKAKQRARDTEQQLCDLDHRLRASHRP